MNIKSPICDKFCIMWNVLFFLLIIYVEFTHASTLELMELSRIPGYARKHDAVQEMKETEHKPENYSLGKKKLTDDRVTEKSLDNSHVNLDLSKTLNPEYFKLRLTQRKSIYNEPSQYSNEYELNDEEYQAPRPRKRRPPQNHEYSLSKTPNPPKIRVQPTHKVNRISENSELKNLLKTQQFRGFSLSEILQQQNLSLNDLLKGKKEIISALKLADTENHKTNDDDNNNNNDTDYSEIMISTENAGFHGDFLNDMSTIVSPTETIFEQEIMEFSDYPKNKGKEPVILDNTKRDIDNDLTSTEPITPTVSMTKENVGFNVVLRDNETPVYDSINFDYQNEEPSNSDDGRVKNSEDTFSPLNHRTVIPENKIYEEMISEIEPEARAEILELINSTLLAQKLENLLKARNMSFDELVALRQRGFSSIHLSQVDPSDRQRLNKEEIVLFNHSSAKNTNIPNINFSNNHDVEKKPIIIDLSIEKFRKNKKNEEDNQESLQLIDFFSAVESLPFAIRTNSTINESAQVGTSDEKIEESAIETFTYNATTLSEVTDADEIQENHKISTPRNLIIEDFVKNLDDDSSDTLSKIQSSIIASCTILAMAIISFLLIFIILRIRQKRRITNSSTFPRRIIQTTAVNTRRLSNCNSSNKIINVVGTSVKSSKDDMKQVNNDIYEFKSDIENDSLDANDSWDTIPDFMK